MHPYIGVLETYMEALRKSDYSTIKGLFTPEGKVRSPFLGEMAATPFFDRLADASSENVITPIDIFVSTSHQNHATCYMLHAISNILDCSRWNPDYIQSNGSFLICR